LFAPYLFAKDILSQATPSLCPVNAITTSAKSLTGFHLQPNTKQTNAKCAIYTGSVQDRIGPLFDIVRDYQTESPGRERAPGLGYHKSYGKEGDIMNTCPNTVKTDRREKRYQKLCATIERTQRRLDKADKTVSRCIKQLVKLERQRRRLEKARAEAERQTADSLVTAQAAPEPSPAPPIATQVESPPAKRRRRKAPTLSESTDATVNAMLQGASFEEADGKPKAGSPGALFPIGGKRARKARRTEDDFKRDVAALKGDR
jgi:hypothetical protein